jgi:hypothetical protein
MTENEKEKILIELKVALASLTEQNKQMQETIKTLCGSYVTKETCDLKQGKQWYKILGYITGGGIVGASTVKAISGLF